MQLRWLENIERRRRIGGAGRRQWQEAHSPTGMAAELTRQTRAKNLTFSPISCPPIPVTLDGTAVTCVGILASVKMNLNVVIDSRLPNVPSMPVGLACR